MVRQLVAFEELTMKSLSTLVACASSLLIAASASAQIIDIYDNLTTPVTDPSSGDPVYLNENGPVDGSTENGDMIKLAGALPAIIDNFTFKYWLDPTKVVGGESVEIRFYDMTGPDLSPTDPTPTPGSSPLYDSGVLALTDSGTVQRTLSHLNVAVPAVFTWSIQFSGGNINDGFVAGVLLYSPPTVGQNKYTFWQNSGSGWDLNYFDAYPTDFGAQITGTPVPEPGATAVVLLLSAVGTVGFLRRRRLAISFS